MSKFVQKYGRYGKVSTDKKGAYTPQATTVLKFRIEGLKWADPANIVGLQTVASFTPAEMYGIAERLDSIAIYVTEVPETWIKGQLHGNYELEGKQQRAHCLMGYSDSCKVLIAKVVDFSDTEWKAVTSFRFRQFASAWNLVDLNDSTAVDVEAFSRFIRRLAVALRDHAERTENGSKPNWARSVDRAFWRQRKTLGLVADKKSAFAGKGK